MIADEYSKTAQHQELFNKANNDHISTLESELNHRVEKLASIIEARLLFK